MLRCATMAVDEKIVRHVAHLARLGLEEGEVSAYTAQLNAILGTMAELAKVPTEGVEPMAHPLPHPTPLREDVPVPPLDPAEAVRNAPEKDRGFFRVPPILEPAS